MQSDFLMMINGEASLKNASLVKQNEKRRETRNPITTPSPKRFRTKRMPAKQAANFGERERERSTNEFQVFGKPEQTNDRHDFIQ
jgi:hypothetical protein